MCARAASIRERTAEAEARRAWLDALTCDVYGATFVDGGALKFTPMVCVNEAGGLPDRAAISLWISDAAVRGCGVEGAAPIRLAGGEVEVFSEDAARATCVAAALTGAPLRPTARCTFALTTDALLPDRPPTPAGESPWPATCEDVAP